MCIRDRLHLSQFCLAVNGNAVPRKALLSLSLSRKPLGSVCKMIAWPKPLPFYQNKSCRRTGLLIAAHHVRIVLRTSEQESGTKHYTKACLGFMVFRIAIWCPPPLICQNVKSLAQNSTSTCQTKLRQTKSSTKTATPLKTIQSRLPSKLPLCLELDFRLQSRIELSVLLNGQDCDKRSDI